MDQKKSHQAEIESLKQVILIMQNQKSEYESTVSNLQGECQLLKK